MKKILVAACLLMGTVTIAQKTDMQQLSEQIKKSAAEVREQRMKTDSLSKSINDMIARRTDSLQKAQLRQDAMRNGDMILRWQKESQAKQKKKMFIYLGMGIFFLAVLIVGLMRKRKQNKTV
jgi:hypothetical protein